MRFRLIYEGDLRAAGNNSQRAPDKWVLRNRFHSQLASLSITHPAMQGILLGASLPIGGTGAVRVMTRDPKPITGSIAARRFISRRIGRVTRHTPDRVRGRL